MNLTKVQQFMLFTLGMCYRELNKKVAGKPLEIALSKQAFIEIVRRSSIVGKKERAIYKNLEGLEKKKLLLYDHKSIHLTPKGLAWFGKAASAIDPYIAVRDVLATTDVVALTKKVRTSLVV